MSYTLDISNFEFLEKKKKIKKSLKYQRLTSSGCKDIGIRKVYGKDWIPLQEKTGWKVERVF